MKLKNICFCPPSLAVKKLKTRLGGQKSFVLYKMAGRDKGLLDGGSGLHVLVMFESMYALFSKVKVFPR